MKNQELRNAQYVRQAVYTLKKGYPKPDIILLWEDYYSVSSYNLFGKWKAAYTKIGLSLYLICILGFLTTFYYVHSPKGMILALLILMYVLIARIMSFSGETFDSREVQAFKSLDSILGTLIAHTQMNVRALFGLHRTTLKGVAENILVMICKTILDCQAEPTPSNKIRENQAKWELETVYKQFESFGLASGGYTEYYRKAGCFV